MRVPVGMSDKSTEGDTLGTRGGCIEFDGGTTEKSERSVKEHKLWERCRD